jgi:exo-beta-1,3-glucanase (GH17 family)
MKPRRGALSHLALMLLLTLAAGHASASPLCAVHPSVSPALARLREAMAHGRFIAYQPTSLQVVNGRSTHADRNSIRADLAVLRPRFDSLVTYRADNGAEQIPAVAASLGYRALIIGVWDPHDQGELAAALATARAYPKLVVGVSLGNEMVLGRRSTFAELAQLLASVHEQVPRLAVSTSEPFHLFYLPDAAPALANMDFLLANVHPVFQTWFAGASNSQAAEFVANVIGQLKEHHCGPILVKETGLPTAPAEHGFTTERQADFYAQLRRLLPPSASAAFAYFSAFDAPWRTTDPILGPGVHTEEGHWGLYDGERQAKPAVAQLPRLPK